MSPEDCPVCRGARRVLLAAPGTFARVVRRFPERVVPETPYAPEGQCFEAACWGPCGALDAIMAEHHAIDPPSILPDDPYRWRPPWR